MGSRSLHGKGQILKHCSWDRKKKLFLVWLYRLLYYVYRCGQRWLPVPTMPIRYDTITADYHCWQRHPGVCELTSLGVGSLRVGISTSCPVTAFTSSSPSIYSPILPMHRACNKWYCIFEGILMMFLWLLYNSWIRQLVDCQLTV